jgi:hypothetical protein
VGCWKDADEEVFGVGAKQQVLVPLVWKDFGATWNDGMKWSPSALI